MKKQLVLMASLAMLVTAGEAFAQHRGSGDWHRDTAGPHRHFGGDRGVWRPDHRPHHSSNWRGYRAPHYAYSHGPYWRGYPSWLYAAPAYPVFLSYPAIEPPVIVERIVEREPVLRPPAEPRAVPQQPRYVEPQYAQVSPSPPAQPAPPRLERYTLSATELFEFDKATLRMPQPKLDEIADVMARNPQIDKVTISGFTDRLGSDAYNLKLSQRRADAVKAYLMQKGVAGSRLTAIGKGEANPVVQCSDKNQAALIKCLEPNRRVEVEQITVERRVK